MKTPEQHTENMIRVGLDASLAYSIANDASASSAVDNNTEDKRNSIAAISSVNGLNKLNTKWLSYFFSFQELYGNDTPILGVQTLPQKTSGQQEIQSFILEMSNDVYRQSQTEAWSIDDWIEAWYSAQNRAIKNAIDGHDRLAIMLSSGIDSAGIAAHLKQFSDLNVKGFSWRFPDHPQADESAAIEAIVKHLNIDHEFIDIEDAECFNDILNWPMVVDAPYFNAMRRMKSHLYERVAEQGYTLLLNGHIGDELAYVDRYYFSELWRDKPLNCLAMLSSTALKQGIKSFKDPSIRYWVKSLIGRKDMPFHPECLTEHCLGILQIQTNNLPHFLKRSGSSHIRRDQYSLLLAQSELNALALEDTYTQQYGIRRVHPFLNDELIALALACPAYLLSTPKQTKWLARKSLEGMLPHDIIWQPRVGQLDILFEQGLDKNCDAIREFLFRDQRLWQHFIDEAELKKVLDNRLWKKAAAVLVPCIGFERWLDVWRENGQPLELAL